MPRFLAGLLAGFAAAQLPLPPAGADKSPNALASVPPALEEVNRRSRDLYKAGRDAVAARTPVVHSLGNELIFVHGNRREVVTAIPPAYHALKSASHVLLGTFAHLDRHADRPLPPDAAAQLREYRDAVAAARAALPECRFDPATLSAFHALLGDAAAFHDAALAANSVKREELERFCRRCRPTVMDACARAAKEQLSAYHSHLQSWRRSVAPADWAELSVVVHGNQTPRADNAAVQYFSRLLGGSGEGERVVYAEGIWDEERGRALLGTTRLDRRLSVAVFGDPGRMFRDILADGARQATDDLLAAP